MYFTLNELLDRIDLYGVTDVGIYDLSHDENFPILAYNYYAFDGIKTDQADPRLAYLFEGEVEEIKFVRRPVLDDNQLRVTFDLVIHIRARNELRPCDWKGGIYD